jgi:tetrapyrrole methylase family protein / MazG family protein
MTAPPPTGAHPGLPARAPSAITIVGLGPGALGDLTLAAWSALMEAPRLLLRTRHHPCVDDLPASRAWQSCDDLYEQHAEFPEVYAAIADRVLRLAREAGGVVYAVPGHPWVGEATTRLILERAQEQGLHVNVIGGLSFVAPAFAAVGIDLMDGAQVVDAMLLARQHHPRVEVAQPLLVAQVYARWLASDLKLTLLNAYPAEHSVRIVRHAGTPQQSVEEVALHALDGAEDFDHLTSVYVPPQAPGRSFSDLQEIVAHLRAPEGCPWDREQTLESMRADLLSECAEVLEAIDAEQDGRDNAAHIAEELGDLLMAATMMVQIAAEEGRFQMGDATQSIVTKLIRRHPHVFGDTQVDGVDAVLVNWDRIKAQEKAARGITEVHPLAGVPAALPALEKARETQSKAAKAGLLDRGALARENPWLAEAVGPVRDEATFGRTLWQMVALAKEHGVVAEDALRAHVVAYRRSHGSDE